MEQAWLDVKQQVLLRPGYKYEEPLSSSCVGSIFFYLACVPGTMLDTDSMKVNKKTIGIVGMLSPRNIVLATEADII